MSILYTLRRSVSARFSELRAPTGLGSDSFKFHLAKLQKLGFVQKMPTGRYQLTAEGKEFANNLDEQARSIQKQPKLSLLIVATRYDAAGQELWLCQERRRNPYWGFWGFISGPLPWGDAPEAAAARELKKQTGLSASCTVRSFLRKRDYEQDSGALLEDKLFIIVAASHITGTLTNTWSGGLNAWMTMRQFQTKPTIFADTLTIPNMLKQGITYLACDEQYSKQAY